MKNLFIGIDFSKQTFDVSFFEKGGTGEIFILNLKTTRMGSSILLSGSARIQECEKMNGYFVENTLVCIH